MSPLILQPLPMYFLVILRLITRSRSGCGKSTALQLILRFYGVSAGEVNLDRENVEDLNISWLRSNIGYVGQQPVLFHGSIRSNILLGKPDATEEEIITVG